jgi:hypothetical protein
VHIDLQRYELPVVFCLLHFLYTSKYVADVEGLGDIMKSRCEQLTQSRKENPAVFHAKMCQIGHYFGVRLLQLCAYRGCATSFVSHQSKIFKTKSSNVSDGSMSDNMDEETCSDEAEDIHYDHSNNEQKRKDGDSEKYLGAVIDENVLLSITGDVMCSPSSSLL